MTQWFERVVLSCLYKHHFSGNAFNAIVGDRFFFPNHSACASRMQCVATLFVKNKLKKS
jgi:hypothetical protein